MLVQLLGADPEDPPPPPPLLPRGTRRAGGPSGRHVTSGRDSSESESSSERIFVPSPLDQVGFSHHQKVSGGVVRQGSSPVGTARIHQLTVGVENHGRL